LMHSDRARRTFKLPGVAGALVQAGISAGKPIPAIGDCVLLNFESGLFALSDSSDRDPGLSRRFLLRFDRMVSNSARMRLDHKINSREIPAIVERLYHECCKILETLRGMASCTFTGIQLLKTDRGTDGLIFHTGDSRLYEYDPLSRELTTLVVPNFWLIGRTEKLFQLAEFRIKPQALFILSTDGVPALSDNPAGKPGVTEIIHDRRVEEIPDAIMNMGVPAGRFQDDAALIALSPGNVKPAKKRIVIGGAKAGCSILRRAREAEGYECEI